MNTELVKGSVLHARLASVDSRLHRSSPGQMLILFAVIVWSLVMMSGLLIDSAVAAQARNDAQTLASNAAHVGSQQVDRPRLLACLAPRATGPANCRQLASSAATAARSYITRWNASVPSDRFSATAPSGGGVTTAITGNGRKLEVTVTRCYKPFFMVWATSSTGTCAGSIQVVGRSSAVIAPLP
jgi:hypothetical protein